MSDKTLKDLKYDAHIAVLNTKVEALIEKQKELTGRVRANEKVVAAIGLLGSVSVAFIGAGYFAPQAEAMPTHAANEWVSKMRDWEAERNRLPVEELINNSLAEVEIDYGSDDTPKPEILLQFPSDEDRQSFGWGYDRCHHRPWIRFIQERTGKNCGGGYSREEN